MRPDKKKKVHHDSQKAKNRALASSNSASKDEKAKLQKNTSITSTSTKLPEAFNDSLSKKELTSSKTESKEKLVDNDGTVSSSDDTNEDNSVHRDYSRRKIESNWTKYVMPHSDDEESEEEATMTGLDFSYVLENARSSDSMFRLKAEKEWEQKQTMFTNEIFSLDLTNLEKAVSCVPLPTQLGISKLEFEEGLFCPKAYEHFTETANKNYCRLLEEVRNQERRSGNYEYTILENRRLQTQEIFRYLIS